MTRPNEIPLSNKSIRIVVAGCFSSGKTAFIRSICEPEIRASYYDETKHAAFKNANKSHPGLEIGKVVEDEWTLYFWGQPGAILFDILWFTEEPYVIEDVLGFVVMVSSRMPAHLQSYWNEASSIIDQISSKKLPYVVAANYQDVPNALSIETLRSILKIQPEIKLLPCIAIQKASAVSVLSELFDLLPDTPERNLLLGKIKKF